MDNRYSSHRNPQRNSSNTGRSPRENASFSRSENNRNSAQTSRSSRTGSRQSYRQSDGVDSYTQTASSRPTRRSAQTPRQTSRYQQNTTREFSSRNVGPNRQTYRETTQPARAESTSSRYETTQGIPRINPNDYKQSYQSNNQRPRSAYSSSPQRDVYAHNYSPNSRRNTSAEGFSSNTRHANIPQDYTTIPRQSAYSTTSSANQGNTRPGAHSRQVIDSRDELNYAKHSRSSRDYVLESAPSDRNTYVGGGNNNKQKIVFGILIIVLIAVLAFAIKTVFFNGPAPEESKTDSMSVADKQVEEVSFTVTFAGDCTLGTDANFSYSGSFPAMYEAQSPDYFFANVVDLFSSDDLTVVNMEGTLTESTARQDKTFAFKGPAEYTQILKDGNVEVASLANNHSHDYGDQSYNDTITALENANIPTFGYDRIAYVDVKGVKVALIGTYELALGEGIKDEMVNNIQKARSEGAQVVMVYLHWGVELDKVPNSTQVSLGHAAVDAGADLVIGSHPHVIQGYEKYNGRYIVYSLGNFCFGGNPNPTEKDCMVIQQTITVKGNEVITSDEGFKAIACSVSSTSDYNNYQPTIATGDEKVRIDQKIKDRTAAIASTYGS